MDGQLLLEVAEEGADTQRVGELSRYLRADLLQLDVDDVAVPRAGEAPPGSRAAGAESVGALLVSLGQSAQALLAVIGAVRDWLHRGSGARRTVRLELDGDALELTGASAADQEQLISLFVRRHAAPGG